MTPRLAALVRKQLIRPERPQLPGEDAFRFRHLLVRDAAYEALPKAVRGDLHERLAAWLEDRGRELAELDELSGYHLEQAYQYRVELGPFDAQALAIGVRAGDLLASAGSRAVDRRDVQAAVNLLRRALALRDPEEPALPWRLDLADMLLASGEPALGRGNCRPRPLFLRPRPAMSPALFAQGCTPSGSAPCSIRKALPLGCSHSSRKRGPCSKKRSTSLD